MGVRTPQSQTSAREAPTAPPVPHDNHRGPTPIPDPSPVEGEGGCLPPLALPKPSARPARPTRPAPVARPGAGQGQAVPACRASGAQRP